MEQANELVDRRLEGMALQPGQHTAGMRALT